MPDLLLLYDDMIRYNSPYQLHDKSRNEFQPGVKLARQVSTIFRLSMEMARLTRDGTAEPVSRNQILRHARGQGNVNCLGLGSAIVDLGFDSVDAQPSEGGW